MTITKQLMKEIDHHNNEINKYRKELDLLDKRRDRYAGLIHKQELKMFKLIDDLTK